MIIFSGGTRATQPEKQTEKRTGLQSHRDRDAVTQCSFPLLLPSIPPNGTAAPFSAVFGAPAIHLVSLFWKDIVIVHNCLSRLGFGRSLIEIKNMQTYPGEGPKFPGTLPSAQVKRPVRYGLATVSAQLLIHQQTYDDNASWDANMLILSCSVPEGTELNFSSWKLTVIGSKSRNSSLTNS